MFDKTTDLPVCLTQLSDLAAYFQVSKVVSSSSSYASLDCSSLISLAQSAMAEDFNMIQKCLHGVSSAVSFG